MAFTLNQSWDSDVSDLEWIRPWSDRIALKSDWSPLARILYSLVPYCLWKRMNELGFKQHLCTYGLNWVRRTAWGWWDEMRWHCPKFEPCRCEAELTTSRLRRLPTILNRCEWAGKKHVVSLKLECQSGVRPRDLRLSKQAALTTATGPPPVQHGVSLLVLKFDSSSNTLLLTYKA